MPAIAPAGSISLLAGNVSSGIEPVFCLVGNRRVRQDDGTCRLFDTADFAYVLWRRKNGDAQKPEYFIAAADIAPADQLLMHSSLQPFMDAAISKTVALPSRAMASDVAELYARAVALP